MKYILKRCVRKKTFWKFFCRILLLFFFRGGNGAVTVKMVVAEVLGCSEGEEDGAI